MRPPIALEELFLCLVHEGFPLGIRDLNEGLRALEAGFGASTRENLIQLCRALWARTEEEERYINTLFDRRIPRLTVAEVSSITGQRVLESRAEYKDGHPLKSKGDSPDMLRVEVSPPQPSGGIGVPRADITVSSAESFILTPRPLVPLRSCVIAWRRYRRTLRFGPRIEVDVEQTIAAKAANGLLGAPILIPPRRNKARLILLVDSGPAMAAWTPSIKVLVDSLRESRLAFSPIFYFHETPDRLFEKPGLTGPVPLQSALADLVDIPAIVVSEGGSRRRGFDSGRIQGTREALRQLSSSWRPLAWLNPMPPTRWGGTSAASIARIPGLSMLPLTTDGLTQAVDLLRGQR